MEALQAIAVIVGVVSGVSGLILGILNHQHQRDTTRPRIVVRPRVWHLADRATKQVERNVGVMEVCNVGLLPVIGSTVGFLAKTKHEQGRIFVTPESLNGVEWTGELKPGHVAMLRVNFAEIEPTSLGAAFAATIVGDTFTATRRDMRRFAEDLRVARLKE